MEIFPTTPSQHALAYNFIMMAGTLLTAYVWQLYGTWLPFVVMLFWCGLWLWDMIVRPWLFPESELPPPTPEEEAQLRFHEWMNRNPVTESKDVRVLRESINKLESKIAQMEEEK